MYRVAAPGRRRLGAYQAGVYQALAEADLHPDWVAGIANRKKVFDMVPSDRLLFAGSHLPFPGLGHAAKDLSGYTYVPLPHAEDL